MEVKQYQIVLVNLDPTLGSESQEAWVVIDQIRTIDKIRIVKKFGLLTEKKISECKRVIRETFVDYRASANLPSYSVSC
jgi:mRNA interferase MazF